MAERIRNHHSCKQWPWLGGGNRADMFSNLDEDTRAQAEDIMEKERAGTITREEAQAQLKELGIDFSAGKDPQQ